MSRPTKTYLDKKALDIIRIGVNAIYEPVRRTLGPDCGTTLMYRTFGRGPRNVDDGHYTAEVIELKDPAQKLAADFFKEAIKRTNQRVGDGTTTTAVIAGSLFNDVYDRMYARSSGISLATGEQKDTPMALKREILSEATKIKEAIREASTPVTTLKELERVAMISLGDNEDIAKKIAKMAYELGPDNAIDVTEGYKGEVEFETDQGMSFPAKVCGQAFVNKPERYEMTIDDSLVIVTDHKIDNEIQLKTLVERVGSPKLTIIAPDFSNNVLVMMVMSRKNNLNLWPVKAPSLRTEQFKDIATFCGANFISKESGNKIEMVNPEDCGFFQKLIVKDTEAKEDADMRGGRGKKEAIQARVKELEGKLKETQQDQFKKVLERRIASLASAKGTIRVGSATDAENLPLKLKIEDVVYACKSALRAGYVKGGGLCLKKIADDLPKDHILKKALLSPYLQIQENAGRKIEIGKDVIDPTEAIYYAVEHATSVVASLITVKNLIPEMVDPIMGEGEYAIARALTELVINDKIHKGQLKESEREQDRDNMNTLTSGLDLQEYLVQENG